MAGEWLERTSAGYQTYYPYQRDGVFRVVGYELEPGVENVGRQERGVDGDGGRGVLPFLDFRAVDAYKKT